MIEIGKPKVTAVRTRVKDGNGKVTFYKVIGADGQPETKATNDEVWRICREPLGGQFGRDKRRKLVAGLVAIDQLVLYPHRTRQEVRVNLADVYAWALRSRAQRAQLERARAKKEKLKSIRERRSIQRADAKLRIQARKDRAV